MTGHKWSPKLLPLSNLYLKFFLWTVVIIVFLCGQKKDSNEFNFIRDREITSSLM